jgi:hypothetical protein
MTVIVSVKINDGIITASDSASTFATGQTYLTADKIVNLVKGLPIGVMVTGDGGISIYFGVIFNWNGQMEPLNGLVCVAPAEMEPPDHDGPGALMQV